MRKLASLILILSSIALMGCSSKKKSSFELLKTYSYKEDFNHYLKNTFQKDLSVIIQEKIFVIPVSSCTPCVDATINHLLANTCDNCAIIFVGEASDDSRIQQLEQLKKKYVTYVDLTSELYNYQTDIGKPSLLFNHTKEMEKMTLNADDWNKISQYLDWNFQS